MSKEFIIEATESSPYCEINQSERILSLEGVSMPENANEFYFPIIETINELFAEGSGKFNMNIDFSYMNSMSNKQVLRLIKHIESKGFDIIVNWKYQPEDELMKIKGEELKRICKSVTFYVSEKT